MKFAARMALAASVLSTSTFAIAEENTHLGSYAKGAYVGTFLSTNMIESDSAGFSLEAEPTSMGVRAGYYLIPQIAIEARYSTSISDDTAEVNNIGTGVDVSLPYNYGAYIKAGYPAKKFEPYLLLGWNKFEFEAEAPGVSNKVSDSGLSLGLGVSLFVNDALGFNLEALSVYDKDGSGYEESITQGSLGVVYSF